MPPLLQSAQLKPDVVITSADSDNEIDESDDERYLHLSRRLYTFVWNFALSVAQYCFLMTVSSDVFTRFHLLLMLQFFNDITHQFLVIASDIKVSYLYIAAWRPSPLAIKELELRPVS